jgi:hypothetical protein
VRYRGQVGELKVRGFVVGLVTCLALAVLIYGRFTFVADQGKDELKATVDQSLKHANDLDGQVQQLSLRISDLQQRVDRLEAKK